MPDLAIVTLVITMVIGGHDIERHERLKSLSDCWDRARMLMEDLRASHAVTPGKDELAITKIGIGCVIDVGDPA